MLEVLLVIIVVFTAAGASLAIAASGDTFVRLSGMAMATLGITAFCRIGTLLERGRATPPWLEPFFRPFADVPDYFTVAGLTAAGTMAVAAIVALVDDYIHLPRRKKGGRI